VSDERVPSPRIQISSRWLIMIIIAITGCFLIIAFLLGRISVRNPDHDASSVYPNSYLPASPQSNALEGKGGKDDQDKGKIDARETGFTNTTITAGIESNNSKGSSAFSTTNSAALQEHMVKTCESTIANIERALESWSRDHRGRYPSTLEQLTPGYLKAIPACPAGGVTTYSKSYAKMMDPGRKLEAERSKMYGNAYNADKSMVGTYNLEMSSCFYTVYCEGRHHFTCGVKENHPQCYSWGESESMPLPGDSGAMVDKIE
jgi:hypothetical protein